MNNDEKKSEIGNNFNAQTEFIKNSVSIPENNCIFKYPEKEKS